MGSSSKDFESFEFWFILFVEVGKADGTALNDFETLKLCLNFVVGDWRIKKLSVL